MKKLGLVLAAILVGGLSLSAPSFAQNSRDSGPYHQDRLPDGTLTGPIATDAGGA